MGWRTKKRILVVEDNQEVQNVLSRVLTFLGFDVALAGNGVEALAVFVEDRFDLVLTDLQMPAMDGLSLAQLVKERAPNTPVILLTGTDRETVRKKVTGGSVDSVLFKPFIVEDLQNTLHRALESRKGEQRNMGAG